MTRKLLLILLLATASPAVAGNTVCTAAMVSGGLCRAETNVLLHYDATPAAMVELRDAITWVANYQATVPCASDRIMDGPLVVYAGVTEGDCLVGEIGTSVPNPQSATVFADAWILKQLLDVRRRYVRHLEAVEAAGEVTATPDPDVE